ncbi:hypothetical protein TRFO_19953 [Tritrichomonas foetus]|uniref:Mitochondrial import inner membrane translocase subunit TIM50 n=1 Tax=Tritrichomonas foetus TaxID=1144522 RepID=A0A1J4KI48_9EUKA|nr:hypothetical protein TRFO_19953 [Tritrichomonas foetus]|eukprot:OHT10722.1 hypothetical protein TRFO_19953 [Tritrichomonas foetus]
MHRGYTNNNNKMTNSKLTVILDLDNTLIFSKYAKSSTTLSDFLITINENGHYVDIAVNKRPKLDYFLSTLSKIATLFLFTAASRDYAEEILSQIDPFNIYFEKVFTREDCKLTSEGIYKKDYSKCITNFSRTIIIDDIPTNFIDYKDNGLPIAPFKGQTMDNELNRIIQIISVLNTVPDVRLLKRV